MCNFAGSFWRNWFFVIFTEILWTVLSSCMFLYNFISYWMANSPSPFLYDLQAMRYTLYHRQQYYYYVFMYYYYSPKWAHFCNVITVICVWLHLPISILWKKKRNRKWLERNTRRSHLWNIFYKVWNFEKLSNWGYWLITAFSFTILMILPTTHKFFSSGVIYEISIGFLKNSNSHFNRCYSMLLVLRQTVKWTKEKLLKELDWSILICKEP